MSPAFNLLSQEASYFFHYTTFKQLLRNNALGTKLQKRINQKNFEQDAKTYTTFFKRTNKN